MEELTSNNAINTLSHIGFQINRYWNRLSSVLDVPLDERIRHGRLTAVDQDYHTALEVVWIIGSQMTVTLQLRNYLKLQDRLKMKVRLFVFSFYCRLQSSTGFLFYSLESIIHDKSLLIILHNIRLHNHIIFNIIFCNKLLTSVLISHHLIINFYTVSVTYIHQVMV